MQHDSVIYKPERTTCKYLHRKDLPRFVVDEGLREHAAEFAGFSGIADLIDHTPIERLQYSEKFTWERRTFDPISHSLAQYHKTRPTRIFLQTLSGGVDGRRSLTQASLVRRYMDRCGTWRSSYRFVLALIQELPITSQFLERDLNSTDATSLEDIRNEAVWDVFFARLSGVQEYGFHSGIETLMWATDQMNGALTELNWPELLEELNDKVAEWTDLVIKHARSEDEFFPVQSGDGDSEYSEVC